ncbi:hypothetical protein HK101_003682, partial [Irineochytrium annulatum]
LNYLMTGKGVNLFNDCVNSSPLETLSLVDSTLSMNEGTIKAFNKNVNINIVFEESDGPIDDGEESDTQEANEKREDNNREKEERLSKKNIISFGEVPVGDAEKLVAVAKTAIQRADGSTHLSNMKLAILETASALADSRSQYSRLKEVQEAIRRVGNVLTAGELKSPQTWLRWKLDDANDPCDLDVFLLATPTPDMSLPLVEKQIIRELTLRIVSENYPAEDVENEEYDDWTDTMSNNNENKNADQSASQAEQQVATADGDVVYGDASSIIWKLQSRLNYAIYLLFSKSGGLKSTNIGSNMKMAVDTVRRLFLFQGIVVSDIRQCNIVCNKVMTVLSDFTNRFTVAHEELEGIKKNFNDPLTTIGGFESDACKWPHDIRDDEYAGQLGTLVAMNVTWKEFEARFVEESERLDTNVPKRQGAKALINSLNQNPNLDVVRLAIDESYSLPNKTNGLLLVDLLARGLRKWKWDQLSISLPLKQRAIDVLISAMMEARAPSTLELTNGMVLNDYYQIIHQTGAGIGSAGAKLIADALKTNTILTRLNLSKNPFDKAAFSSIAEILACNKTLKALILQRTSFNDDAALIILNALTKNTTLTELDLADNSMTDVGLTALSPTFRTNTAMTKFSISNNLLEGPGIEALGKALSHNKSLIRIDTGAAPIGKGYYDMGRLREPSERQRLIKEESLAKFLNNLKQSNVSEISLDFAFLN